jgi:hypothetical protein
VETELDLADHSEWIRVERDMRHRCCHTFCGFGSRLLAVEGSDAATCLAASDLASL